MLTESDLRLISMLPKTEYGQAQEKWIAAEIATLEGKEESGLKLSDDPISEDFRYLLGMKIAFKRVLRKPQECEQSLIKGERR